MYWDLRDHGWFLFFPLKDNPQIAGAIFAEHAEHGYLAAPIARHLIDTYFSKLEGRPLPKFPAPPSRGGGEHARWSGAVMFERRLYFHIDWSLVVAIVMMCGLGLAIIYSTTYDPTRQIAGPQVRIQIYALVLGRWPSPSACRSTIARSLSTRVPLYGALVVALLYVVFFGDVRGGSRRWIDLGPINLQPSEFARVTPALVLAGRGCNEQR